MYKKYEYSKRYKFILFSQYLSSQISLSLYFPSISRFFNPIIYEQIRFPFSSTYNLFTFLKRLPFFLPLSISPFLFFPIYLLLFVSSYLFLLLSLSPYLVSPSLTVRLDPGRWRWWVFPWRSSHWAPSPFLPPSPLSLPAPCRKKTLFNPSFLKKG